MSFFVFTVFFSLARCLRIRLILFHFEEERKKGKKLFLNK